MPESPLEMIDPRTVVRLRNTTCAYCGRSLDSLDHDEDHVIGRRFVPKGKLHQSWNLILSSCVSCNNSKSDLEDDLSALTMQPDAFGGFAQDDQQLRTEASRKAADSVNRRGNRRVGQSWDTKVIEQSLGPGVSASFSFLVPPQLDLDRAGRLARFQLSALFYWISYDLQTRRGGAWPGGGVLVNGALRGDWGNSLQRSFVDQTREWQHRVHAIVADGYFKASIRRHPSAACWAWALEWNHNARLIGLFGERQPTDDLVGLLTELPVNAATRQGKSTFRFRKEAVLDDADDKLFEL